MEYLLDTNILSALIKEDSRLLYRLNNANYRRENLFISCINYFESKGGLLAVNSQKKLAILENLCKNNINILFLDKIEIVNIASNIYANLRRKGTPIQVPDILIAATAIYHNLVLVSNDSDMLRVEGLIVENWLQ
ncbi:MAG: type II toxin-antitoxin system VapC family toxin [Okeania sp. SIO3I5]|uniref:PIN domain-containing protein n=1 Tax=Okeania sp. SIO3I5 TaxID=2607805 RepID=UPI0013BDE2F2|nr:PIN domain-containing protein [Okeania sp. SIO3I5]NEQ41830.1 type II toxin-antitoxin system VapC family toxin [Okeania sp. SIO3I5]